MSQVGWCLRRGVAWAPLLGCCAGALLLVAVLERWPGSALVLLPALVACCAGAAAFCFDEAALPVVEVTPRGGTWRRRARLAVAGVPLLLWVVAVALRPGDLALSRGPWWLVGFAAIMLAAGVAALASRYAVAAPGGPLAAGVVLAVIGPVIVTAFLGWDTPYPVDDFGTEVVAFWSAVAALAVLTCAAALRPALRS